MTSAVSRLATRLLWLLGLLSVAGAAWFCLSVFGATPASALATNGNGQTAAPPKANTSTSSTTSKSSTTAKSTTTSKSSSSTTSQSTAQQAAAQKAKQIAA